MQKVSRAVVESWAAEARAAPQQTASAARSGKS
jgi:hypothetical protein